ncbi:uncharacterized protein [Argopecten irradians]|uniref:uncharacterized protein isoform X3 n=1 Tax=Argopecten irradians TaxID=31199 RepID=UPI00371F8F53
MQFRRSKRPRGIVSFTCYVAIGVGSTIVTLIWVIHCCCLYRRSKCRHQQQQNGVKEAECQTDTNTLIFAAVGGSAMVIGLILSFILYWYCHYHTRTEGGGFEIICPASIVRQFSIIAMPNVSQDVID